MEVDLLPLRAAPHVVTADAACLGRPRLQVGPAAGDVSNPGRYSVLGYVHSIEAGKSKVHPPAPPSYYNTPSFYNI